MSPSELTNGPTTLVVPHGSSGGNAGEAAVGPLVRIRSLYPGLARAEQRVAKVVLDDPSTVAGKSITEVALAAGTSETTVTRFCKAIGIGGYPQLRIALAADTARTQERTSHEPEGDIEADDDLGTVVGKIGFAEARAVEDTAAQLHLATLKQVIDAVAGPGRVDIYAVGASALAAADLQLKLHRIGKVSFVWSDTHLMLTSAGVLSDGDVALAISHSGASSEIAEALNAAAEHGATTVAVTNFPRSPIGAMADYTLTTAARETAFRTGSTASRIAQLMVTDCLFIGVAQRLGPQALRALDAASDPTSSHRLGLRRRRPRESAHQ